MSGQITFKNRSILTALSAAVFACLLFFSAVRAQTEEDTIQIAVSYCTVECDSRPIMTGYSDRWLLGPADEYNHRLMQASFVLAASAFRDNTRDYAEKDYNIRNFLSRAGYSDPRTDDYDRATSGDTVASAIAHKEVNGTTLIAVAVSGNNYQNEWLNNFALDDRVRAEGFNKSAGKILTRIKEYIRENDLTGPLRLWITGYSRAAAIANITAADATDSGIFEAVFGYTIGTPRTTRETDANRYGNIFNIINPFDPVPLVPFPEWGFRRYGTDLYLPSMETDSGYISKLRMADEVSMKIAGSPVRYNPQVNAQLHTLLDYALFYIRSAYAYKENFQNAVIELWQTRDFKSMLQNLAKQAGDLGNITLYQMKEFYYFLDYLCQVAYTSFRGQKFNPDDLFWDPGISIQENLMHEHYDSAYLAWIFASDDPTEILTTEPGYYHYTITGNVDVELFDSNGDFIEGIKSNGEITIDAESVRTPGVKGKESGTILYASRDGSQTLIILPKDQNFSAMIYSPSDQNIQCSLLEYSAGAIQANVRYIYSQDMDKGTFYEGVIDRSVVDQLSKQDLTDRGFYIIEPWSQDSVYSPSAVMRLENTDVFHPSPFVFLTFSGLALLMAAYILVLLAAGLRTAVVRRIRTRKKARQEKSGDEQA